MYGLFCHVYVPLVRGHPVDADSGQRTADSGQRTADSGQRTADSGQRTAYVGYMSLLKRTVSKNTAKKSQNIWITRWRWTERRDICCMTKQRLNSNKEILPNLPNWVWIISFISDWCCLPCFLCHLTMAMPVN